MVACYVSGTNMDARDNQDIITHKNMPNVETLPAGDDGLVSGSSLICSELEEMDEYTEVNVPSDHGNENHNLSNKIHDDFSANIMELEFHSCHTDDGRTKEEGHQFPNEKVFNAVSLPVESNAYKRQGVCAEFAQFDYVLSSSSKVEGNEDETISTTSIPLSINLGEIEVRDSTHEENCNMESDEAAAGVGAEEKPEYEMQQLVPKLRELGLISQTFDPSKDDFPSVIEFKENVTLHKQMDSKSEIDELNYDGGQDGVNSVESSPCHCLNSFTFKLDGLEASLHLTGREISEAQEPKSGKSFETDVLSMLENNMLVPDACAVPVTDTDDAIDKTKIPKCNQLVMNGEPEVAHISVVELEENAWLRREVTPNSIANFSESKTSSGDDIWDERKHGLVATINSSNASFRILDIDSEGVNSTSVTLSDQVNHGEVFHEESTECAVGDGSHKHVPQADFLIEHVDKENSIIKESCEELGHQYGQIKQFETLDGPLSHELDPCSLIQDQSNKHTAGLASEDTYPETKVQVDQITKEDMLSNLICDDANQNTLNHPYAQSSISTGDKLEDTHACVHRFGGFEVSRTNDVSVEFASATCSHSLQDEGDPTVLEQNSNTALVVADTAVDSSSLADSVEVQWGSTKDGASPSMGLGSDGVPISEAFTLPVTSDLHASTSGKEDTYAETENADLFEAPSFFTLVEPGIQPISNEIQSVPYRQLTKSSPFRDKGYRESPKRKCSPGLKAEEIFSNAAKWSPGKRYIPLETLLYEANLQSKQRTHKAQDSSMPPSATDGQILPGELRSPKMANHKYKETSAGGNQQEWNTPARLPIIVRKRRGRLPWKPFICCPSAN